MPPLGILLCKFKFIAHFGSTVSRRSRLDPTPLRQTLHPVHSASGVDREKHINTGKLSSHHKISRYREQRLLREEVNFQFGSKCFQRIT